MPSETIFGLGVFLSISIIFSLSAAEPILIPDRDTMIIFFSESNNCSYFFCEEWACRSYYDQNNIFQCNRYICTNITGNSCLTWLCIQDKSHLTKKVCDKWVCKKRQGNICIEWVCESHNIPGDDFQSCAEFQYLTTPEYNGWKCLTGDNPGDNYLTCNLWRCSRLDNYRCKKWECILSGRHIGKSVCSRYVCQNKLFYDNISICNQWQCDNISQNPAVCKIWECTNKKKKQMPNNCSGCSDNIMCKSGCCYNGVCYNSSKNADNDRKICLCSGGEWIYSENTCCGDLGLSETWCGKSGYCARGRWVSDINHSAFYCKECLNGIWVENRCCFLNTYWRGKSGICKNGHWVKKRHKKGLSNNKTQTEESDIIEKIGDYITTKPHVAIPALLSIITAVSYIFILIILSVYKTDIPHVIEYTATNVVKKIEEKPLFSGELDSKPIGKRSYDINIEEDKINTNKKYVGTHLEQDNSNHIPEISETDGEEETDHSKYDILRDSSEENIEIYWGSGDTIFAKLLPFNKDIYTLEKLSAKFYSLEISVRFSISVQIIHKSLSILFKNMKSYGEFRTEDKNLIYAGLYAGKIPSEEIYIIINTGLEKSTLNAIIFSNNREILNDVEKEIRSFIEFLDKKYSL